MFSRPNYSGEPTASGQFSQPQVTLTNNYSEPHQRALVSAQQRHQRRDSVGPERIADAAGARRLRLQYRHELRPDAGLQPVQQQYALQAAGIGGWGRKGADKLLILETDGMANQASTVGTVNNGAYNSYYNTPPLATISASGDSADTDAINVATVLTSLNTTSNPIPGFSTASSPVTIQCIVFGAIFEPGAVGFRPVGRRQPDAVDLELGETLFSPALRPTRPTATSGASARWPNGSRNCRRPSSTRWIRKCRSSWCRTSNRPSMTAHQIRSPGENSGFVFFCLARPGFFLPATPRRAISPPVAWWCAWGFGFGKSAAPRLAARGDVRHEVENLVPRQLVQQAFRHHAMSLIAADRRRRCGG